MFITRWCSKAVNWVGDSAIPFVQNSLFDAANFIFKPVGHVVGKNPISKFQMNAYQKIDQVTLATMVCLQSYQDLSAYIFETVKSGSYLATAVAGAYLYDMAIRRAYVGDSLGKKQRTIGLSMAVIAGSAWLYRIFKGTILPSLAALRDPQKTGGPVSVNPLMQIRMPLIKG
jgi:hypothetical protein